VLHEHPVIIDADFMRIEVLDASFSVEKDSINQTITVALEEGKLRCTNKRTKKSELLAPSDQAIFYKNVQEMPKKHASNTLQYKRTGLRINGCQQRLGHAIRSNEQEQNESSITSAYYTRHACKRNNLSSKDYLLIPSFRAKQRQPFVNSKKRPNIFIGRTKLRTFAQFGN